METQLITIAITLIAIFSSTLVNNNRIGNVKEVLSAEFSHRFDSIDRKLDDLIRIEGDHETRLAKLEERDR